MYATAAAIFCPARSTRWVCPLFLAPVSAGFPSPAEDYIEGRLDLNKHLIKHPAATFFVRVAGDSMTGSGIHPGDILVVDRSIEPQDASVVIAVLDGELTVKRISRRGGRLYLVPDNSLYQPLEILEGMEFEVWGVVTSVIHSL
ncbi:MAG: translesion error-prone DNA polymerase V autoproteolytic subunit [Acidobacteria bacterium]|nr:translesion error-prone DNA polymerase V autoproteolytic subunit [Acidobacteriota bacterium]MCA1643154.1 translesion error-prone DNA polymerase V autoproteolytic subunit [Acidobacteriota bacterium]